MAGGERVTVEDSVDHERYEAELEGEGAAFLTYRRLPDRTVLLHTEVADAFEGRGIGSSLVRAALDGERARGQRVEPRCPFVATFINRHPEYEDLVPGEYRVLLDR